MRKIEVCFGMNDEDCKVVNLDMTEDEMRVINSFLERAMSAYQGKPANSLDGKYIPVVRMINVK